MENKEKGQIALIVILVMVVIGTIALSVASRSVTDVDISRQEEEKIRAFSAAEAGIEDLLAQGLGNVALSGENIEIGSGIDALEYDYEITPFGAGGSGYELGGPLKNGETTEIKLEGGTNLISLELYWDIGEDPKPALEVSVFNSDNSISRYAFKARDDTTSNDFEEAEAASDFGERDYRSSKSISLGPNALFVRVKALYNQTYLGVKPTGQLPVQAYKARVNAREGEAAAALEVVQAVESQIPVAPVFDYVLWSGEEIVK